MKKFLSIIAIVLVAATLFTGCMLIPIRRNFSQYGVYFTIAGNVTEKEGNKYGDAVFYTTLGTFHFERMYNILSGSLLGADNIIAVAAATYNTTPRTLKNGASYFTYDAGENSSGNKVIGLAYAIQVGSAVWAITCTAREGKFNRESIINACMSAEFC